MSVHFSSASDNWSTPTDVYKALDAEFGFNYDPCPLDPNPTADGLLADWGTSTFCNPPYSQLKYWIKKAFEEWRKGGKTIVLLIPSRTDTIAWHEYVMKADEIRFIKGRLKFGEAKFNAPFPSAIVVFRPKV